MYLRSILKLSCIPPKLSAQMQNRTVEMTHWLSLWLPCRCKLVLLMYVGIGECTQPLLAIIIRLCPLTLTAVFELLIRDVHPEKVTYNS